MDFKDGWIKKLIFNGLEANCFRDHFALTLKVYLGPLRQQFRAFWMKLCFSRSNPACPHFAVKHGKPA